MMQFIVIFICLVLFILMWVWCRGCLRGRAVMHYARPSLFIFAVLSAVLRSGFRDTAYYSCVMRMIGNTNKTLRYQDISVPRHFGAIYMLQKCPDTGTGPKVSKDSSVPVPYNIT